MAIGICLAAMKSRTLQNPCSKIHVAEQSNLERLSQRIACYCAPSSSTALALQLSLA